MDLHKYIQAPAAVLRPHAAQSAEQTGRAARGNTDRSERIPGLRDAAVEKLAREAAQGNSLRQEPGELTPGHAVKEAREALAAHGVELRFRIRKENGAVQVEVRDPETNEVIRKIPEDELLRLSTRIRDFSGEVASKLGRDVAGELAGALMDRPV